MSVYTILDVAISLALIYLTLSIFCSALKEWIARWLDLRSTTLKQSINVILKDPTATGLAGEFHRHPLVTGLRFEKERYPGYIPTQTFAKALADIAIEIVTPPGSTTSQPRVRATAAVAAAAASGSPAASAVDIGPESRRVLETLLRGNLGSVTDVETRLGRWFDDSMERASGWYKRKAQLIIVAIAAILTIGLKVDTIAITKQIWVDPTLRAEMVQRATAAHDSNAKMPAASSAVTPALDSLEKQLPIGWSCWPGDPSQPDCKEWSVPALALTVPGLLLTIIALSLGAPFWFDLLNKLVNLRQSGTPPDEEKKKP